MSRFPFVFPCNFLYAGSMLYALCNVVDKKQHFYDLCNLCNLCTLRGFAAFCCCLSLSSFLHFFISSLCQNLISETLLRYGALLISPRWGQAPRARPTQSYPFLLHLQRPDVERRKLNLCPVSFWRWEGMICSQYDPLTPICLSALKGKALVCTKPFEVSKLSETWKGADVPHVQRSCFRSCWKSIEFIRNKRSVEELSKSALLDLLAKMVSKKQDERLTNGHDYCLR